MLHKHCVPERVLTAVLHDRQFKLRPPLQVRHEEWQDSHQFEADRYLDETQDRQAVALEQVSQAVGQATQALFEFKYTVVFLHDKQFVANPPEHVLHDESQTMQDVPYN